MFDKQQHNQSDRSIVCTCNACHMHIETRYHCSECEVGQCLLRAYNYSYIYVMLYHYYCYDLQLVITAYCA